VVKPFSNRRAVHVWATLRQAYDLFGRDHRRRWLLLIWLALVVSGFEMLGAVLVYALLALVVDPSGEIDLPLVGDLRGLFGDVDERVLSLSVIIAMALFFLLRSLVKVGATYLQARVAHNAGARLSTRLVQGYLHWPYAAHLRRSSAESIRNGHQAVLEAVNQVVLPMIRVVAEAVLVMGMLAVLVAIAPAATGLAVLVVGGAVGILLAAIQPRIKRLGRVNHRESRATLASLQESLLGLRDIKILGREAHFARIYGKSRARMARARYLYATAAQLPSIVIETALLGFILLFFAIVLIQGGDAQQTLSVLGLFGYIGLRLQPSLRDIVSGLNHVKFASAPLEDLHADLRAVEPTEALGPEPEAAPFRDRLAFERVSFSYPTANRPALREIDLTIRPGEQLGIAGPTGGGKTTLIDVMTGLLEPSQGRVTVDGADLREHVRAWQRNLGVVPQMVFLTDDTLRRNIALGISDREIDEDAVEEAVRLAQLQEFIGSLPDGLDTRVGERGVRISGGQRQRIAIARALYRRPSVLVFDEGTSALDNVTEVLLMDAIERLRGDHTIVLIAHRLSTVRSCDRVVFLEQGQVTGLGPYDELVRDHAAFRAMAGAS
jgi:ATP-binding cassette, subfamily B, bacterial PglK